MKIIKCDGTDCQEERQILDMRLPSNWTYCGDFEFCPKCKEEAQDYNEE